MVGRIGHYSIILNHHVCRLWYRIKTNQIWYFIHSNEKNILYQKVIEKNWVELSWSKIAIQPLMGRKGPLASMSIMNSGTCTFSCWNKQKNWMGCRCRKLMSCCVSWEFWIFTSWVFLVQPFLSRKINECKHTREYFWSYARNHNCYWQSAMIECKCSKTSKWDTRWPRLPY